MLTTEKNNLFDQLKAKYGQLAALVAQIQTKENSLVGDIVGNATNVPPLAHPVMSHKDQMDSLGKDYNQLSALVKDIQTQENILVTVINPAPAPAPAPAPKQSIITSLIGWLASLNPLTNFIFKAVVFAGVLALNIQSCQAPAPEPNPPDPNPAPKPVPPDPNPTPKPVPPVPVTQKLYAVQVFNSSASDAATQAAVAVAGDPNISAELLALNVEWRHWDSQEPLIDKLNLRLYLPDPAKLPVMFIYDDKGQFFDLNGNKLARDKPIYQQPPKTVDAMVNTFKTIRAK